MKSEGSPPPMRGKAYQQKIHHRVSRITPAYAGKSHKRRNICSPRRDHPRLCGEKTSNFDFQTGTVGSPPPMRGKVLFTFQKVMRLRDHPRLCGEKLPCFFVRPDFLGSPPPMRGKVFQSFTQSPNFGITPAYAGKSDLMGGFNMAQEDHPRLCGEKT